MSHRAQLDGSVRLVSMTWLRRFAHLPGCARFLIAVVAIVPFMFLPSPFGWVALGIVVALSVSAMILGPSRVVSD